MSDDIYRTDSGCDCLARKVHYDPLTNELVCKCLSCGKVSREKLARVDQRKIQVMVQGGRA